MRPAAAASLLALVIAGAAQAADAPREVVAELAPKGSLRAAINYGNTVLVPGTPPNGPWRGVSPDLARALAEKLGVPIQYVPYETAGKVTDAVTSDAWDICFLAVDPVRGQGIAFTAPYVIIEGAYVVPQASPLKAVEDVDRDGVRIAVSRGSAYDLYLTRALKHAALVRDPDGPTSLGRFLAEKLEVAAGVKQPIVAFAAQHPETRVIPGRFMAIEQAMGTHKERTVGAAYLKRFVEDMKASGMVARELAASGQTDAAVAPPAPAQ
ncbi:MAG: ABC transporter substrate-binding protein [Alphaproteobacteria bacterium]|nr:ABC transporter substrate-binding protein [Alphaproteobacteria bacterium]